MATNQPPTEKGARQSQEILDAAMRCLGRDGYAATSLARIADEAGVSKRMVLYYFESREDLFVQLASSIGQRLVAQLEDAMSGLQDPSEAVHAGVGRMWEAITSDRALLIAVFGISVESMTDERLAGAAAEMREGMRKMLQKQFDLARANGRRIVVDDEAAITAIVSGFLGLAIEWLQAGESDALNATIAGYEQIVAAMAPLA